MSDPRTPKISAQLALEGVQQVLSQVREIGNKISSSMERASAAARGLGIDRAASAAVAPVRRLDAAITGVVRSVARVDHATGAFRRMAGAARQAASAAASISVRAGAITAATGVGAIVSAHSSATWARDMERYAKQSGTELTTFTRLAHAANRYGVEAEDLAGGLSAMSDKIAEAARGEGALEFFNKLGIAVKDTQGNVRETGVVFQELVDRLSRLPNRTLRANFANELLGGDGEKLAVLLQDGLENLQTGMEEADVLGITLNEDQVLKAHNFAIGWLGVKEAMRGVRQEASDKLYPALTTITKAMRNFLIIHRGELADTMANFVKGITAIGVDSAAVVMTLFSDERKVAEIREHTLLKGTKRVIDGAQKAKKAIKEFGREIDILSRDQVNFGALGWGAYGDGFGGRFEKLRREVLLFGRDLIKAFSGNEAAVTEPHRWLITFREWLLKAWDAATVLGGDLLLLVRRAIGDDATGDIQTGWLKTIVDMLNTIGSTINNYIKPAFRWFEENALKPISDQLGMTTGQLMLLVFVARALGAGALIGPGFAMLAGLLGSIGSAAGVALGGVKGLLGYIIGVGSKLGALGIWAAIAVGLYELVVNFDDVKAAATRMWDAFRERFPTMAAEIEQFAATTRDVLGSIWDKFKAQMPNTAALIGSDKSGLIGAFIEVVEYGKLAINGLIEGLSVLLPEAMSIASDRIRMLLDGLTTLIDTFVGYARSSLATLFDGLGTIKDGLMGWWQSNPAGGDLLRPNFDLGGMAAMTPAPAGVPNLQPVNLNIGGVGAYPAQMSPDVLSQIQRDAARSNRARGY